MRKNPTLTTYSGDLKPPVEGIDNLPIPSGVNQTNLEAANTMPAVGMTPNNGDQRDVATPAFANGTDKRNPDNRGGSSPYPAMPGC